MSLKPTQDKFRKARGGYSRVLEITCRECSLFVCKYQKDGPGNLRRMYIDRISEATVPINQKEFTCPKGHILGVKYVYKKENRPAFRLFVDAVTKRIIKAL